MGYLVAVIILFIGIVACVSKHNIVNPTSLFCFEWALICFLAAMRLFTLYEADWKTWFIILFGTISFVFGSVFGSKIKIGTSKCLALYEQGMNEGESDVISDRPFFIKKRTLWILIIILFVLLLSSFAQSMEYLKLGYTLGEIREASVGQTEIDGYVRQTGTLNEFLTIIRNTIEIFTVAGCIDYFVSDYRKNYKLFIAVILFEVMHSLTSGGRFNLAYLILELVVCLIIYKKNGWTINFELSPKVKRWIKRVVVALVIFIVVITLMRGTETTELIKKYYRYICGDVVFFDLHVEQIESSGFWSFPYAGFYGFWSLFLPLLNRFGISYPQKYLNTIDIVFDTQVFRRIGDSLVTNAFITPFYHLYADGRFLGVFLGMFLFGAFASYHYKKAMETMSQRDIIYYLIISQMIFKTLQMYPLTSQPYFVALIVMMICNRKFTINKRSS